MFFATWLSCYRKLSPPTVTSYLSAVRSLHVDLGLPDPMLGSHRLHRLVRGVRRQGPPSQRVSRLPVTNRLMVVLGQSLAMPSFNHRMFWAACCAAFFGFLRVGEFTCPGVFDPPCHLSRSDISLDSAGCFLLHLKRSKSDPFARGCVVLLAPSGSWICPVSALANYLELRGSSPGPLFVCDDGRPLTPGLVNKWLRAILSSAGVVGNYSSHSFRIGAATSAALAGVPDHLIKVLGRWSSDAYLTYIRTPPEQLMAVARHLV